GGRSAACGGGRVTLEDAQGSRSPGDVLRGAVAAFPHFLLAGSGIGCGYGPCRRGVSSLLRGRMALCARTTTHDDRRRAPDLGAPGLLAHGPRYTIRELVAVVLTRRSR